MPSTDEPWSQPARWSTPPALLLAVGVVLVVGFVWRQLLTAAPLMVLVQFSSALKWALAVGTVCLAVVWAVASPRVRAATALVGGLCGSVVTVGGIVLDPYTTTAAGYAVTLGTLSILLAGVLETARRFDWNRRG